MERRITAPMTREEARSLRCGEQVLLSGVIYTARDAAHKRLVELLERGEPLPLELRDAVIYYVGPTPPRPGEIIGSAGPTTSYRMDAYAPLLIQQGLTGMIGKGRRGDHVKEAMKEWGAVYFGAVGGAGALLRRCVKSSSLVAYEDLESEAIRRLEVEDMPLTVIIDAEGNDLYERGPAEYLACREKDGTAE